MRRLILLAFIGAFLTEVHGYPSNLAWLFGANDKLNESREEGQAVCQSPECHEIAKVILDSMNKSADPCDDFYEYACGEYQIHNPLPEGQMKWSLFYQLGENAQQKIKEILEAGPMDNDLFAAKLVKKWYKSCMNTDAMDLDPLVSTISRIGGWPMIMHPDEWDEQEYSWQKVDDQYMRLTGRNTFHDVRIDEYWDQDLDEIEKIIHVDVPHLPPASSKLPNLPNKTRDKEGSKSDEDPSDEENRSDDEGNSREPWSESEEDSNDGKDYHDNDDHGNNEDENSADNEISDDDTDEKDNDENAVKKVKGEKKTAGKIGHKKSRKLEQNRRKKNDAPITKKHKSHKAKQQRVKRRAIATKVNNKRTQHSVHREKLRAQKSKRNQARKVHEQMKTVEDLSMILTTTAPRVATEETEEKAEMEVLKQYADYISKVARAVANIRGIEVSEEYMDKDIEDMIEFQLKLTDIIEKSRQPLKLTLNGFQEWYDEQNPETAHSKIDWVYKIEELFDEAHVVVDGGLDIEVLRPDYFKALVSLLDETPSRTIVNYIHWNFISRIIKTTTSELRELYDEWKKDDEKDDGERFTVCIKEGKITDILAYEYVRRYFSDDITKIAMDMLDDVQKEMEYQIKESDWLDDDTKDFVLVKLVNMRKLIGYPDWYTNTTIVKRYFQGLIIGKSYYENTLSYDRYAKWKKLRTLTRVATDVDKEMKLYSSILEVNPAEVNAFYVAPYNFISITAADFQSPFFAYNRPNAINFGIIGFVMAHEANHGFDDKGHLYDKDGDNLGWLSTMAEAYGKRIDCFLKQFNNYPVDKASNKKIENYGNQTIGDNIADTMGLQAGFKAYRRRERECGKQDTVLPGLEAVTNDQLFFLSFANIWCEAFDPEYEVIANAKTDEHSTGRLRVIGSVSNSEDFAKAYNCPVGSPMNPEKKCSIWK